VERDRWPASGGLGELSHHALDDCHDGSAKSRRVACVKFSKKEI